VTLEAAGTLVQRVVTVAPDETIVVGPDFAPSPPTPTPAPAPALAPPLARPHPPPAPPPLAPAPHGGLSPLWLYAGLGATAVAGAFTIGSGVDTANQHASFQRACGSSAAPGCDGLASGGRSAQERTNVLIAVTAGLGAATLVTALFVRWRDVSLSLDARRVSFDARF